MKTSTIEAIAEALKRVLIELIGEREEKPDVETDRADSGEGNNQ